MSLLVLAPMAGWSGPLDEASDPVFSDGLLGDGLAIDPTDDGLYAPCAGEVVVLAPTGHAVTIRSDEGVEILIHIGLETVGLNGEGFDVHVQTGARVQSGDLLIRFDLDVLARRAKSLLTPVVIANSDRYVVTWRRQDQEVAVGQPLMALEPRPLERAKGVGGPKAAAPSEARRTVRVGLIQGVHARPAARIAATAKTFAADLVLEAPGRRADMKSAMALLTLAAGHGEAVTIWARGADAGAAASALAACLEAGEGWSDPRPQNRATDPLGPPRADPVIGPGRTSFHGITAVRGIALGRAVQFRRPDLVAKPWAGEVEAERRRLSQGLAEVRIGLKAAAAADYGASGDIFAAHLALLDDEALQEAVDDLIRSGLCADFAWSTVLDAHAARLSTAADALIRARARDLIDLKRRLLTALSDGAEATAPPGADAVVLADDLSPSEAAALGPVAGLCTAEGGPTSHVALMASALNIPMLVAVGRDVLAVPDGAPVILDASRGVLRIDPTPDVLADGQAEAKRSGGDRAKVQADARRPCRTADGAARPVFANLASIEEARLAVEAGAEGCGLLRTEFLFMDRQDAPDEGEQLQAYQAVADALDGRPLVIRTLDIGGDKPAPYLGFPPEPNPALGLRGVRTSLRRPDLLRVQLRAILQVSRRTALQIMTPMVVCADEVRRVRAMLDAEAQALGVPAPPLGIMIETPAAAATAGLLAQAAAFFSVGTNDLAQYALAMDRGHSALAAEADALHPGVLRLIAMACDGARGAGRTISLCGGLASDPLAAPLLVGLGVGTLSAAPAQIGAVKAAVRRFSLSQCEELARRVLGTTSAREARTALNLAVDPRILGAAAP